MRSKQDSPIIEIDLGELDYYSLCELRNLLLREANESFVSGHVDAGRRHMLMVNAIRTHLERYSMPKEFSNELA